jgi:hypothetical protein
MISTPAVNVVKPFFFIADGEAKHDQCSSLTNLSNIVLLLYFQVMLEPTRVVHFAHALHLGRSGFVEHLSLI